MRPSSKNTQSHIHIHSHTHTHTLKNSDREKNVHKQQVQKEGRPKTK